MPILRPPLQPTISHQPRSTGLPAMAISPPPNSSSPTAQKSTPPTASAARHSGTPPIPAVIWPWCACYASAERMSLFATSGAGISTITIAVNAAPNFAGSKPAADD